MKLVKELSILLSEVALVSNAAKEQWANKNFETGKFKDGDIVWLQDRALKFQGFYKAQKDKFKYIGAMPQGIDQKVLDKAPILHEAKKLYTISGEYAFMKKVGIPHIKKSGLKITNFTHHYADDEPDSSPDDQDITEIVVDAEEDDVAKVAKELEDMDKKGDKFGGYFR